MRKTRKGREKKKRQLSKVNKIIKTVYARSLFENLVGEFGVPKKRSDALSAFLKTDLGTEHDHINVDV